MTVSGVVSLQNGFGHPWMKKLARAFFVMRKVETNVFSVIIIDIFIEIDFGVTQERIFNDTR